MGMLVSIGTVARLFGVVPQTIRNWESKFRVYKTLGGHRRYDLEQVNKLRGIEEKKEKKAIIYARVSSWDQKEDLQRQTKQIEDYCNKNHMQNAQVIKDIGSGINYKKRGLKKLINEIMSSNVERLVISYQDRLLRFGSEILWQICNLLNIEVVILNEEKQKSFEEKLVDDVLTVYCSKIYGRRSHKKKLVNV